MTKEIKKKSSHNDIWENVEKEFGRMFWSYEYFKIHFLVDKSMRNATKIENTFREYFKS